MPLQSSSSFRRFGQRDDRRRRLLADDLSNSDGLPACGVWSDDTPPPGRSEHYGDAEFLDQQLRLLDLVPRRALALLLPFVVAAAVIVGLESAYGWMLDRVASGRAAVAALDLAAKGSLGGWFSSLLLLAGSAAAIAVYSVRRHRSDDYRGRYRIWLWAAACWFLLAADQTASLREAFRDLMTALTGTPLAGDGTIWWVALYAIALGAVGSRLSIDMRSDRLSTGVLLAAAAAYALAAAGRLGWILPEPGPRDVMLLTGAEMTGNLLLLAAMTFHARHVLLDAEGLLPRRGPRADDELAVEGAPAGKAESSCSADDRWMKIDPPHDTRRAGPAATLHSQTSYPGSSTLSSLPAASAPVNRKLTKAERKALKERLLRERLERQRRG